MPNECAGHFVREFTADVEQVISKHEIAGVIFFDQPLYRICNNVRLHPCHLREGITDEMQKRSSWDSEIQLDWQYENFFGTSIFAHLVTPIIR